MRGDLMGVKFDNATVNNHAPAQTVEEAFRVFGSWADIHDYNFDDWLTNSSLSVTRTTANDWSNKNILSDSLPYDVMLSFDIPNTEDVNNGFAAILGYSNDLGYAIGIDTSGNIFFATYDGTNMTILQKKPVPFAVTYGSFRVAFRQQSFSSRDNDIYVTASMWVNDALLGTFTRWTSTVFSGESNVGFASYGTNASFAVENIRIPQLTQYVEWNSIDPGETPMGGLQRTIQGRYLKWFARYDGSIRAWRSHPVSASKTFANDDLYTLRHSFDKRQLYSHVRILGAWAEAEFISGDLISKYGHRFTEVNNPYLMSVHECYAESRSAMRRMAEQALSEVVTTPFNPLLEVEDRITTPNGERIITKRDWNFSPGTIDDKMVCRLYGFAS
jgi:hypothetical protein